MAITGFDDVKLKAVLAANLTPSDFIKTRERLFGRDRALIAIDRALSSPGRQIFIYGDRGVGKSSLALTAAYLGTHASLVPVHVNCSTTNGFSAVIQAIGNSATSSVSRMQKTGTKSALSLNILGVGGSLSPSTSTVTAIPSPQGLNEALDIVKYLDEISNGAVRVVVIDEMERLKSLEDKEKFAEFIKTVSTVSQNIRFIFCGIARDLSELLGAHPSAGRILETIELTRIPHDSMWQIIETPAAALGVHVDRDRLIRISQISDGFPHYVHLVGESLFWSMFDDTETVARVEDRHYRIAIREALGRTEAVLREQYDQATKKTKNTEDYEEALWALADKKSDRRQLTDIYEYSYCKIMMRRMGRNRIKKEQFNQRLLSLRKSSHGEIVHGYGSGWFGFRENIMRGYVRLDAENKDVALGRD